MPAMSAVAEVEPQADAEPTGKTWEGVLGTIGSPTEDGRYLVPGEITNRDLPVEMHMQPAIAKDHDGALPVGRIDKIDYVPFEHFARKEEFYTPEQIAKIESSPVDVTVVFGSGELNGPHVEEAQRRIDNGADVSIDGLRHLGTLFDSKSYEQVDTDELDLGDILSGIVNGEYLQGLGGQIGGVTIVAIGAFSEAKVGITASASLRIVRPARGLTAAAGPLKPPREWFEHPNLTELTPLQITKEGRVFGHLCDWDGCHTGFQGICVPPFRSPSNYGYFNVGEIECADGDLVPCGKLMFSRKDVGHAPLNETITIAEVYAHYDDATCVGAFVRAGEDKFGTWLAGALRSDLNDLEIQHLRTHPPSGDWRPIKGQNDLLAAFAVPVPGFPIRRALVASANGAVSGIISAPLEVEDYGSKRRRRRKVMLMQGLREALGTEKRTPAQIRHEVLAFQLEFGPWSDYEPETLATITAADRQRWAKSGVAMRDGSYPITKCTGEGTSAINARRAIGRAPESKRPAVRAHINRRERALGCSND
jgi:hypothetical protein